MLNIVLVEPEIPNNTGNIGRLCVGTNASLHLIHPLGFELTDKYLKRSGLDYWKDLDLHQYDSLEQWLEKVSDVSRVVLFSKKAKNSFIDYKFEKDDWLVFGKESVGLSEEVINKFEKHLYIPTTDKIRSHNLANAVTFAMCEAIRQINGFKF